MPSGSSFVGEVTARLDDRAALERIRRLSRLLDSAVRVPGTRFRVGLDPLIGLIPGLGDLAGLALSAYLVQQAHQFDLPKRTRTRMLFNLGLEAVVGAVPLLGDLFDAWFKANMRNLRLLERELESRGRTP